MIAQLPTAASSADKEIWAAIVCYRAKRSSIENLLAVLLDQVSQVLIVDNDATSSELSRLEGAGVTYLPMTGNQGTAGAMNSAWRAGLQGHAEFMVCFDQDSEISPGFIGSLLRQWQTLQRASGQPIGGIGPVWKDRRTGRWLRALKPAGWHRQRVDGHSADHIEVDHLISSGCLIHRDTWLAIGPFDESLFLDYVDIEWNLRARSQGFRFFVTRNSEMCHSIGDSVVSIFGRSLWIHQPVRQYLLVRNHLLLWRRPYIRLSWKCRDAIQVAVKTALVLALSRPRWQRLGWILRGLWDGLLGRSGPIM